MCDYTRFLKVLVFNIIPSWGDIGSDVLSALDFLSHNANASIAEGVYHTVTDIASNATFLEDQFVGYTNATSTYPQHKIWASIGISLIFAPGIPAAAMFLMSGLNWIAATILFFCYPVVLMIMQFWGLCHAEAAADESILVAVSFEAFFESGPQMVLQIFSIQYGYPTTTLQVFTICLSFILLAKTSVMFDMALWRKEDYNWKETTKHVLTVIPVYTTGIVFRIGALSIITAYIRYWSVIPILISCVEYAIIAKLLGYPKALLPIAVVSNIGSMTKGVANYDEDGYDVDVSYKFLLISTVITFLHQTACLVTVLAIFNLDPSLIPHRMQLKYFEQTNGIVGGILAVGLANLVLLFVTRKKLE